MKKKPAKIFIWIMTFILLQSAIPLSAGAQAETLSLEEALVKAKAVIAVPAEYSEFSYSFDNYDRQAMWRLTWSKTDGNGSINVSVQAENGDIVSFDNWQPESRTNTGRIIMLEEAKRIAEAKLAQLIPDKKKDLVMLETTTLPLSIYGTSYYSFNWQRRTNGIPFAGDQATMNINSRSGEITGYYLNWTEGTAPSIDKAILPGQASEAFTSQGLIEKKYLLPTNTIPVRSLPYAAADAISDAKLVFALNTDDRGECLLDAFTGQRLIIGDNEYTATYGLMRDESSSDMDVAGEGTGNNFTPQETAELDKNKLIISQEEAVNIAAKYFPLPSGATVINVSLRMDWRDLNRKVWDLHWQNPDRSSNVNASIDANSGRLYSYNCWSYGEQFSGDSISGAEARQIAENCIKKIEPELYASLKLKTIQNESTSVNSESIKPIKTEGYVFEYIRTEKGISCINEGINIRIAPDGKIQYYNLNWGDANFPALETAMSLEKGCQIWLEQAPLSLCYIVIRNNITNESKITPVYKSLPPSGKPGFSYIDAVNGERLNGNGDPIDEKQLLIYRKYTDISGHFAEAEITMIGEAGLLGRDETEFRPEEPIVWADYLRTVLTVFQGIWSVQGISDEEIIKICQQNGYIDKEPDSGGKVTHAQALQVMVRVLNLNNLAVKGDIFVDPFPEDSSVTPELKGYVSIAKGLNIFYMPLAFNAEQETTRGEAAYAIIRAMNQAIG